MTPFLVRCPKTGLRVQGLIAEDASALEPGALVSVACHACGGVHLVDVAAEALDRDDKEP